MSDTVGGDLGQKLKEEGKRAKNELAKKVRDSLEGDEE